MIIKIIIFTILAMIIQLSASNWFNILIYAAVIGIGSNSYRQSLYLGFFLGLFPWLFQFLIKYNDSTLLLERVANMFYLNSSLLLIIFSIIFITTLCVMVSVSSFHIKKIIKNDKR
jgi:hypothetical protein